MTARGLLLLLALSLACAGCGSESVGSELDGWWHKVAKPAIDDREAGLKELKGAFDVKGERDPYGHSARYIRERVIPPLDSSHQKFLGYKAQNPVIKQANKLLADEAEIGLNRMRDLARAVEKHDESGIKSVVDTLKTFDKTMIEIVGELHLLSIKTGVRLKLK